MPAGNRRRLPALRRVVAYMPEEEWDYVVTAAAAHGWTVSRFVAWCVTEQHELDAVMLHEIAEERRVMEGG